MNGPWTARPLLDRLGMLRTDGEALRALWHQPGSRLLAVDPRGVRPSPLGDPVPEEEDYDPHRHVLLGQIETDEGAQAWFAHRAPVDSPVTLRDEAFEGAALELVTAATAVLAWHDAARHCERCGGLTEMAAGGFQRRCRACDRELFPRTDPAMIVAVLDEEDRLLLAHQASWPEGRVSILAGFLESGESAEHAVVREVAEESGLTVCHMRYLSSQPWPYPRSLMLGFVARASGEVAVDGQELAWARWYTPESLAEALQSGVSLPGPGSIAGRIISAWRQGELPAPEPATPVS